MEFKPLVIPQPDPSKAARFQELIRSYWPAIDSYNLVADYCGIRPKINVGDSIYEDFYIAVRLFCLLLVFI